MEEWVGEIWHKLITRMADTRYPDAVVTLKEMERTVGIMFRALGGDGGLQVEASSRTETNARRNFLKRVAQTGKRTELAWRDDHSLHLPAAIDLFPSRELNRDLYIWLSALAVGDQQHEEPWFSKNQRLTQITLNNFPGIQPRYQRLVEAHLTQRISTRQLPADETAQEEAIEEALKNPGSRDRLPSAKRPPQPVPLWLHPFPPITQTSGPAADADGTGGGKGETKTLDDDRNRTAERAEKPKKQDQGLITVRMENIFTWGDFLNLDRGSEENDDLDDAADIARDMDTMSVSRDSKASASKLKFDLDLPSEANDDLILNEGILVPEWDYQSQILQPDYCRIVPMVAAETEPRELPEHLRRTARKLRAQFQHLAPSRTWHRAQPEGCEIDLDAYLRFATDRASNRSAAAEGLYKDLRVGDRDLCCLLLADLSLSTDSWIDNHSRIIEVIRDSLFLFAESLHATGDPFAMYGFSSRKRDPIRFHQLKTFNEHYSGSIRGRIDAIKPGYYTRMGAAIRHSTQLLKDQPANRRLLLIITDGKPNDLDRYEGRYGVEDTRHAVTEARDLGLQPFCVTIDAKGNDYLPHLFGSGNYVVIHRPSQLPRELPQLYARLTT
ncbi:MAG: VWA domain-containing protein [Gammaproteobacteria bacterium]|nr:VWA domain-containing protein [Gammaproteobacteria bacterium]